MNGKVRRELELPANVWEALDLVAGAVDWDPDELAAYCVRSMLICEAEEDLRDLAERDLSSTSRQVLEILAGN